jgi:hypothetical protein
MSRRDRLRFRMYLRPSTQVEGVRETSASNTETNGDAAGERTPSSTGSTCARGAPGTRARCRCARVCTAATGRSRCASGGAGDAGNANGKAGRGGARRATARRQRTCAAPNTTSQTPQWTRTRSVASRRANRVIPRTRRIMAWYLEHTYVVRAGAAGPTSSHETTGQGKIGRHRT